MPRRTKRALEEAMRVTQETYDEHEDVDENENETFPERDVRADEERAHIELWENYGDNFGEDAHGNEGSSRRRSKKNVWDEAKLYSRTRIFEGSKLSTLSAIMLLLNLQGRYNVPNAMLDDLFRVLHEYLLPTENAMPDLWTSAKKILRSLGLKYEIIHACPNDCMLYRGDKKDESSCSECDHPRYRPNMASRKIPYKSMRYFPLIPRLLHSFRCSDLAELMVWHSRNRSEDGVMRLAVDSPTNKLIETRWPEFKTDPRHLRLGLATDGVSPYTLGGKGQPYSVWPVVLTNYNIPPWCSMKRGHLMLSMVIPGPKQAVNIDVYLAPLIDELKMLWDGVPAYDARKLTGGLSRSFSLKAILMWTMHDFPGNFFYFFYLTF